MRNRTLREFPSSQSNNGGRYYAWRSGTIQPFSSLWVTVYRFALLNRPNFPALKEELQDAATLSPTGRIKLDSATPWPRHSSINLQGFAAVLNESIDDFKWSSTADLPNSLRHFNSLNTRMCPTCIGQAFHSVIFSAPYITRCPRHGDRLMNACPRCGQSFFLNIKRIPGVLPNICKCTNALFAQAVARRPPSDPDRDKVLGDIVRWAEYVGHRYWTYIPQPRKLNDDGRHLGLSDHIYNWQDSFGERIPGWLSLGERRKITSPGREFCTENSGIKIESLARVKGAGRARLYGHSEYRASACQREAEVIFKCMRRYFVKHLVANKVSLLIRIGTCCSIVEFRKIISTSRYGMQAWSLLYWMQRSYWGETTVRAWFLKILNVSIFCHWEHDPTRHWGRPTQMDILADPGCQSERWIVNWINASILIDLWPDSNDFELFSSECGYISAAYRRDRRELINWWGWLGESGMLNLSMSRRSASSWMPQAERSAPKWVRRNLFEARCTERLADLRLKMCEPVLRLHEDGGWRVEGRRSFAVDADLRCSRLSIGIGRSSKFGAGLDPSAGANSEPLWYFRSLDFPVCVLASTTKDGVKKLKAALRAYIQHLNKPNAQR